MGDDAAMLAVVSSANIACGGHASDPDTMYATLCAARDAGVVVGAHPGYVDREGFGRRVIPMTPAQIGHMIAAQIGALQAIAREAGTGVAYVKPHGALGNLAARDADVARRVTATVAAIDPELPLLAISGTALEQAARATGTPVFSEIFADRGYQTNGQLVPRGDPGAMIDDPAAAADRLLAFLDTGRMPVVGGDPITLAAQSVCVHGDSPHSVAMAREIRDRLTAAGVAIRPFMAP
ncbi:MAG: 5-oxoprolinase subunit PxpA [Pseudomonadota bacterium]